MDNEQMGRRNREEGAWGESTAADFLVAKGGRIVARNARPCARDRRCEIDVSARSGDGEQRRNRRQKSDLVFHVRILPFRALRHKRNRNLPRLQ